MKQRKEIDWDEFEKKLDAYCEGKASQAFKDQQPTPLLSPTQQHKKLKTKIKDSIYELRNVSEKGWMALLTELHEMDLERFASISDHLELSEEQWEALEDDARVREVFSSGGCMQSLLNWPDEVTDALYDAAVSLYEKKRFEEAISSFTILTCLNPKKCDYWVGLGLSKQIGMRNWKGALEAYFYAMGLEQSNPYAFVYYAECLEQLGENGPVACYFLDHALEMIGNREEMQDLSYYCISLKKKIQQGA